jgi:hydroxypyruvate isomerase
MLRFSANISTLFQDSPLAQRFEAAARAGFQAIEIWFPYEMPAAQMRDLLQKNGLRCVGINSPFGDAATGDWGLAADPRRREQFEASIVDAFDYARQIDCPNVHVMAGHRSETGSRQAAWENYLTCIGRSCDLARENGLTVMIEPLNAIDRPLYLLQTQAQALTAISQLGRANLKIMLDVYHLQRGEGNLIERMLASLPHAAHVQVADNPGRHEPGTGEINYASVFAALEASGYGGYVGCEFYPSGRSEDSFTWLHRLLDAA